MDLNQIFLYLTPFIVWGVTAIVKKIKPLVPGWVLVSVVVPLLSVALALAGNYAGNNIFIQFGLGLLAVFIAELLKQIKQGNQ